MAARSGLCALLLVVGGGVVGGTSCKDERDPCVVLYERKVECLEPEGGQADHVRKCRELLDSTNDLDHEYMKARLACATKKDCVAFEDCLIAASKARSNEHAMRRIETALESHKLRDAYEACASAPPELSKDEEAQRLCARTREGVASGLAEGSLVVRCPAPSGVEWFDTGVVASHCHQRDHGRAVASVKAEVDRRLAAGESEELAWLPACTELVADLQTIDPPSTWSTEALGSVRDACFERLAGAIVTHPESEEERCQGTVAVLYIQAKELGLRPSWHDGLGQRCGF